MRYEYQLEHGPKLFLENDSEQTSAGLSSGGSSQQQSQARGFDTGVWEKPPTLQRHGNDYIVSLHAPRGPKFLTVQGDRIVALDDTPDLASAKTLPLTEAAAPERMKPMAPMKPMEPMRPMEPMQPLPPMQMRMGSMQMSMGGEPRSAGSESRFCTQCGRPVQPTQRFCGSCGHAL